MLLQITLFHSSGWVIFHCIYVPNLLYPFLSSYTVCGNVNWYKQYKGSSKNQKENYHMIQQSYSWDSIHSSEWLPFYEVVSGPVNPSWKHSSFFFPHPLFTFHRYFPDSRLSSFISPYYGKMIKKRACPKFLKLDIRGEISFLRNSISQINPFSFTMLFLISLEMAIYGVQLGFVDIVTNIVFLFFKHWRPWLILLLFFSQNIGYLLQNNPEKSKNAYSSMPLN